MSNLIARDLRSWCVKCLAPTRKALKTFMFLLLSEKGNKRKLTHTSIPHFIELHFIVLWRYFFFFKHKLKICGNPLWSKSIGTNFQQHLLTSGLCVSCFGNTHAILQNLTLLLHLLLWSVVSGLYCYHCKMVTICWSLRWWSALFSNKVFFNSGMYTGFRHKEAACLIDHRSV